MQTAFSSVFCSVRKHVGLWFSYASPAHLREGLRRHRRAIRLPHSILCAGQSHHHLSGRLLADKAGRKTPVIAGLLTYSIVMPFMDSPRRSTNSSCLEPCRAQPQDSLARDKHHGSRSHDTSRQKQSLGTL